MAFFKSALGAAAIMSLLSACTTGGIGENAVAEEAVMTETVSGSLTYRERIALPPDATISVALTDITEGPDQEQVAARTTRSLRGEQVPVPFQLTVPNDAIEEGHLYGLRAFINGSDGDALFRTYSPMLIDMTKDEVDVGTIILVAAGSGDPGLTGIPGLHGGQWVVEDIAGRGVVDSSHAVLTFEPDGSLNGNTGCNGFFGSYQLDANEISTENIGVTQRACVPALNDQERRFLDILNDLQSVSIDSTGALVLTGEAGETIRARRQ